MTTKAQKTAASVATYRALMQERRKAFLEARQAEIALVQSLIAAARAHVAHMAPLGEAAPKAGL